MSYFFWCKAAWANMAQKNKVQTLRVSFVPKPLYAIGWFKKKVFEDKYIWRITKEGKKWEIN